MINAVPAVFSKKDPATIIERCLDQLEKEQTPDLKNDWILGLAKQGAVKKHEVLSTEQMQNLVEQLFASEEPGISPQGKTTLIVWEEELLDRWF